MNLKEAFRYQNHLDHMLTAADLYLSNQLHTVEVTQTHHRSKVDPEATDEVLTSEQIYQQRGVHYEVSDVVNFMMALLKEKRGVSIEITNAKRFSSFQLDHELACNKVAQRVAMRLGALSSLRPKNRITTGAGRRFNAEGNQITYTYDVEESQTLAFDREVIRGMSKELLAEADEVSNRAECFMLETLIHFEPIFDVNDSFEEAIEGFIKFHTDIYDNQ